MLTERPQVSEIVECSECSVELEVLAAEPLTLALAPEVEEDWGE
jgi:alpha-aminoadipate/glutamate carrier protein LysW